MQLYVIRHGQTYANVLDLCDSNVKENSKLTGLGLRQAENAAKKLKNIDFDAIFVSELFRTHQTARIINKFHKKRFIQDKRLDDLKTGFDGKPDLDYRNALAKAKDRWNAKFDGGESFEESKERVFDFLDDLKKEKYKKVLIVTHEHTIKVMMGYFYKLNNKDIASKSIKNCQILKFSFKSKSMKI
jgi:probable phosphoglycerate mutase